MSPPSGGTRLLTLLPPVDESSAGFGSLMAGATLIMVGLEYLTYFPALAKASTRRQGFGQCRQQGASDRILTV